MHTNRLHNQHKHTTKNTRNLKQHIRSKQHPTTNQSSLCRCQNNCTKRLKTISRRAPQPHYLKRQILNQSPFLTPPFIFLNYPSISYGFYNLDAFYLEFGISTTITRSPPFRKEKTLATNLKIWMCIINFSRLLHMIFVHM